MGLTVGVAVGLLVGLELGEDVGDDEGVEEGDNSRPHFLNLLFLNPMCKWAVQRSTHTPLLGHLSPASDAPPSSGSTNHPRVRCQGGGGQRGIEHMGCCKFLFSDGAVTENGDN